MGDNQNVNRSDSLKSRAGRTQRCRPQKVQTAPLSGVRLQGLALSGLSSGHRNVTKRDGQESQSSLALSSRC